MSFFDQNRSPGRYTAAASRLGRFYVFTLITDNSPLWRIALPSDHERTTRSAPPSQVYIYGLVATTLLFISYIKIIHNPLQKCALLCFGLAFEKFVVVVVLLRQRICDRAMDRALSLSRPCGLFYLGWFGCCLSALNGALLPRGMTSLWLGHGL